MRFLAFLVSRRVAADDHLSPTLLLYTHVPDLICMCIFVNRECNERLKKKEKKQIRNNIKWKIKERYFMLIIQDSVMFLQ